VLDLFDEIFEIENDTLLSYKGHDSTVVIPDEVAVIGNYAFNDCATLEVVVIPETVKEIGNMAFANCDKLKSVTVPDNVTKLGSSCFSDCRRLEYAFIGAGVIAIGESPFLRSPALTEIRVSENNQKYRSEDGVLLTKDGRAVISYPAGKVTEEYSIPEGVAVIATSAFWGAEALVKLSMPDTLTHIGNFAFQYCKNLSVIETSASLKVLGSCVFGGCESLSVLRLPKTIASVGYHAVADCPTKVICSARKKPFSLPSGFHKDWIGKSNKSSFGRRFKKQIKERRKK
jgi:hypothetical protein